MNNPAPKVDTRVYKEWPVEQTKQFPCFEDQWSGNKAINFANEKRAEIGNSDDVWLDIWGTNDDPHRILIVCWRLPSKS